MMLPPFLRAQNVSCAFGHHPALVNVSFDLNVGEIVGVVGRRGAGKSTLLRVLAGLLRPQSGALWLNGQPLSLSPSSAARLGLELVPQITPHIDAFDVLPNIFLGREWQRWGLPNWTGMAQRAREILDELGAPATLLNTPSTRLTDEQWQTIAIARALCAPPTRPLRGLWLDDAFAPLSFERQARLLALLPQLAQRGVTLLISSDNLKPLFAITHRLLILRDGQLVAERRTADVTPREIVELIVGSGRPEQVTPLMWALESYHAAQQQAEELRQVQANLQESLEAQGTLNQELVHRLRDQVQALDQLNLALQATQRRLMTEREAERKALARDLHDQTIQDLLSFNYQLEDLEGADDMSRRQAELAEIRLGIRQVVGDLRQLCSDLRPPTIDSHGLAAALRSHAQEWAERAGISLTLEIDPDLGRLPEAMELSLFRIVQEGLNNIRKHAAARRVWLAVHRAPANLIITLRDDGRGLARPADLAELSAHQHFGLVGISERIALLNGALKVDSAQGQGTTLLVEIPNPAPAA
jgi:signal transduction histidine kinase